MLQEVHGPADFGCCERDLAPESPSAVAVLQILPVHDSGVVGAGVTGHSRAVMPCSSVGMGRLIVYSSRPVRRIL